MMPSRSAIATAIDELLDQRAEGKTICPSEVARKLGGEHWRELMQQVRDVAAQRSQAGELMVTRAGKPVDPREPQGPIRLGRPRAGPL